MSTTFNVAPWRMALEPIDFSVAFAAGDNWSLDGSYNRSQRHPGIVNVIALASGGLRLNTPSETRAKLDKRRSSEAYLTVRSTAIDTDDNIEPGGSYPQDLELDLRDKEVADG